MNVVGLTFLRKIFSTNLQPKNKSLYSSKAAAVTTVALLILFLRSQFYKESTYSTQYKPTIQRLLGKYLPSFKKLTTKSDTQLEQGLNEPNFLIEGLPEDIRIEIFSYLSYRDACQASLVCKNWKAVLNSDHLPFKAIKTISQHILNQATAYYLQDNQEYGYYLLDIEPTAKKYAFKLSDRQFKLKDRTFAIKPNEIRLIEEIDSNGLEFIPIKIDLANNDYLPTKWLKPGQVVLDLINKKLAQNKVEAPSEFKIVACLIICMSVKMLMKVDNVA